MNEIIVIVLLILLNGILAMSEIALISVRKTYLSNEIKHGSKLAKTALKLANEPDKFLSTIQIGITVIGIITGIYSGSVLADDFSLTLISWGVPPAYSHPIAQSFIVIFVTYLTLVFGELVPKRIGMSVAEKTSKIVARPMYWLAIVTSPFVWILSKSTSFIFKLFGFNTETNKVTEAEIKSLIEEGTKGGEVQEVEQDIVERVFLLGDLKVNSLMTPRCDIVALDINMSNEDVKAIMQSNMYGTYPVIDKTFDNVKGVVLLKDIVFSLDSPNFYLEQAILTSVYFHENMSVYKAMEQMKVQRLNHALVCDEFGSCQGIITLKDILKGLVGTIDDNQNEADIIKRKDADGWLVDGQCSLYDFLSYFQREDLHSIDNDYSTLGGLILELLEHIPQTGEKTSWYDFSFEIVDMDGVRIDKVLVTYSIDVVE